MRGKRRIVDTRHNRLRIIPAHAGQTKSKRVRAFSMPDHPRACGANSCDAASGRIVTGSSPRMRGKHGHLVRRNDRDRIIPAHAGQTSKHVDVRSAVDGSSPRMRGKRRRSTLFHDSIRIIPAHAGQTVRFYAKTLERWTLNNWIRTVAPIFVLLFLPPVIGQNAYIERHYSNQSFSWFSKLHYASAFDLSLVA